MSPITHALIGWSISQPLTSRRDRALTTIAAVIPDIDGLTLLGGVDLYHEYHHTFGHNVFLAILFSTCASIKSSQRLLCFFLCFLSFHSHLLCDLLGSGADWGIHYIWPVSMWEIRSFPPFQWELQSWQNLVCTILFLGIVIAIGIRKGRTIIELFSLKADSMIVEVFRKWARK